LAILGGDAFRVNRGSLKISRIGNFAGHIKDDARNDLRLAAKPATNPTLDSGALFGFRPDPRLLPCRVKLDVDDVGIAAHGAVFDVLLLSSLRSIQWDDDLLPAGWTDVVAFIQPAGTTLAAFHANTPTSLSFKVVIRCVESSRFTAIQIAFLIPNMYSGAIANPQALARVAALSSHSNLTSVRDEAPEYASSTQPTY
jgi:hypothetical protein